MRKNELIIIWYVFGTEPHTVFLLKYLEHLWGKSWEVNAAFCLRSTNILNRLSWQGLAKGIFSSEIFNGSSLGGGHPWIAAWLSCLALADLPSATVCLLSRLTQGNNGYQSPPHWTEGDAQVTHHICCT